MMRRRWIGVSLLIGAIGGYTVSEFRRHLDVRPPGVELANRSSVPEAIDKERAEASALGRVEGAGETVEVGAATDGRIEEVYVEEGRALRKGDLLAKIGCEVRSSAVTSAVAELTKAEKALALLRAGTRKTEVDKGMARVEAAKADTELARRRLIRLETLRRSGDVSEADFESASAAVRRIAAIEAESEAHVRLLREGSRAEEVALAEAEVNTAIARISQRKSEMALCSVLSPLDGVIVRSYAKPGTTLSGGVPSVLFEVADVSRLRIRAEVDERDVARVFVGQSARVFGMGVTYTGVIAKLTPRMGVKRIHPDTLKETRDADVREVLIDLKERPALPLGLRVTVLFLSVSSRSQ